MGVITACVKTNTTKADSKMAHKPYLTQLIMTGTKDTMFVFYCL